MAILAKDEAVCDARTIASAVDFKAQQRSADGQNVSLANFIFRPSVKFDCQRLVRGLWRQGAVDFLVGWLLIYYDLTIEITLNALQTLKTPTLPPRGDSF